MSQNRIGEVETNIIGALPLRFLIAWLALVAPLGIAAAVFMASRPVWTITTFFLVAQDLLPLVCTGLILLIVCLPFVRLGDPAVARLVALAEKRGWWIVTGVAAAAAIGAFIGWFTLYQRYPLVMDEFWAQFDATIFQSGRFMAQLPVKWRAYADALQPAWPLVTPGGEYWSSRYLPMNAAFRALFGVLGSQALAGPFWAALSIVTVYALGRRLWPARRDAALVSALLLATSSQLVITAMSPYAMSAHLALNLVWLWLFLRRDAWSQGVAPIVAFAATGLHQFIFHPLFAAPFVLSLWLERRWRLALFHTLAYALICLFWVSYWSILMKGLGVAPKAAHELGTGWIVQNAANLITSPIPGGLGLMILNLLRFIAWQNPLAVALGALGTLYAVRSREPVFVALAAGMVLTVILVAFIMPFQGHGWGYRYLHGFLGSLCLLAGFAWIRLTPTAEGEGGGEALGRAWAAFCVIGAFCLVFALPLRAWQAFDLIRPFARAHGAIEAARADVVVVDPAGLEYGQDFVRNDPFLAAGPKVMNVDVLTQADARALCASYKVALFDITDGRALGVRANPPPIPSPVKAATLGALSCAAHVVRARG